jgi:FkbM family methyltransferase
MNTRIKLIQLMIEINEKIFFYPKLKSFYKNVPIKLNPPIILDVGANKGQSIDFFRSVYPTCVIYAFEPNPRLFTALEKKYGDIKNIHLINKGVSNKTAVLELKETVMDETSTFEELNYDSTYLKVKSAILGVDPRKIVLNTHQVEVITLSEFINEYKLAEIHTIKIDTEGNDFKVILGAKEILKVTDLVIFEVMFKMIENGNTPQDAVNFLKDLGFRYFYRSTKYFGLVPITNIKSYEIMTQNIVASRINLR